MTTSWLAPVVIFRLTLIRGTSYKSKGCCLTEPCLACVVQGHALFVRQAGGVLPCPQVDFTGGFNGFLAAAYNLGNSTIEEVYGSAFGKLAS